MQETPAGSTCYISPCGNDRWSGQSAERQGKGTEGPWATLEGARDSIRRLRKQGRITGAVQVRILPGLYRLDRPLVFGPEDGGTAAAPVTWSGINGRPIISGAREITGWTQGAINGVACWQAALPDVAAGRWWFTQLFVNGRRRLRARLPKQGFYRFTGVPAAETRRDKGDFYHGAMSACFARGEIRAFRNLDDIEVVVPDHWFENHLRIASVDEQARVIRFATVGHSRFSKDETGRHARFRLDHVAEGCTEPGEWYLDRSSGVLSYIPMPGEDMNDTRVEAPALDLLLSVRGNPLDPRRRVRHLRFEHLDFRHADWELPRDNAGAVQAAFNVPAAVRFAGAEDCALYACRVSQVAGWGVELLRGCHRNRVVGCAVHDLGGGGIKVGHEGGLPRFWVRDNAHAAFNGMDAEALGWGPCREDEGGRLPGRDTAEPSATTISDCSIHDGGIIFHSATGIWVGDASRNRIVHNRIFNFNYTGISCGWNWGYMPAFTCDNRIEGNHVHHIGHGMLSDMGAIYTLGRQAGSTVRRNFIHDVRSNGYGGWGIYPDEGSSWMLIEENVVCATKCGGFHQNIGRDNLVRKNVFAASAENQVAVTATQMVRPLTFEKNLVQAAGNGHLWSGLWGGGWDTLRCEGNLYACDPGVELRIGRQSWADWQADGRDRKGRLLDAALMDAEGAAPAVGSPAALRAIGLKSGDLGRILAEAGPRFKDVMPPSIDDVPPEPERRRPFVESIFLPAPASWPAEELSEPTTARLPKAVVAETGKAHALSLTLENRGDAAARGSYRLRVIPAAAARIRGPSGITVALKPGARAALETAVVPSGKHRRFRIEAVARGEGLCDSCLFWELPVDGQAQGSVR